MALPVSTRSPVPVALCGLGRWGGVLLRELQAQQNLCLRAVCDLDPAALEAARPHVAVRRAPRLELVLDADVDAVVLSTPPETHAALAQAALRAGKHVFVEKPLALRSSEAETIVRHASQVGRLVMVGHVVLHHPGFEALTSLVSAGTLGRLQRVASVRTSAGKGGPEQAWWALAPHDLACILQLAGVQPARIRVSPAALGSGVVANVQLGTMRARIECKLGMTAQRRGMRVWLDSGATVEFDELGGRGLAVEQADGRRYVLPVPYEQPLSRQLARFADGLLAGGFAVGSGLDAVDVVRLLEAGAESLHSGSAVAIPRPAPAAPTFQPSADGSAI